MLISVDFDGTLTRSDVQKFVLESIANGNKVVIVTQRYTEAMSNRLFGQKTDNWNQEVIDMGRKLGISKIYFTDSIEKYLYLQEINSDLHLDDSNKEVISINQNLANTFALNIQRADWLTQAKHLTEKANFNYN